MIERLRLRIDRAGPLRSYYDRYDLRWAVKRELARCVRCGWLAPALLRTPSKAAGYCNACIEWWSWPRVSGPFQPMPAAAARCKNCNRPLETDDARARGLGHVCERALATEGQGQLGLEDVRARRAPEARR